MNQDFQSLEKPNPLFNSVISRPELKKSYNSTDSMMNIHFSSYAKLKKKWIGIFIYLF